MSRPGRDGSLPTITAWLDGFAGEFGALSDELTQHYFSLTVARVS
jgi:hypothetical protein